MSNWGRWALPPPLLLLLTDSLEEVNLDPYFQTCKSLVPKRRRACGLTMMQVVLYSSVTTYILRGERGKARRKAEEITYISIIYAVYLLYVLQYVPYLRVLVCTVGTFYNVHSSCIYVQYICTDNVHWYGSGHGAQHR
jgi:hypothetical protein